MLGEAMEQRDFLERHQQVGRDVGQLPLELGGVCCTRSFGDGRAQLLDRVRVPKTGSRPLSACRGRPKRSGRGDLASWSPLGDERSNGHQLTVGRRRGNGTANSTKGGLIDDFGPAAFETCSQMASRL